MMRVDSDLYDSSLWKGKQAIYSSNNLSIQLWTYQYLYKPNNTAINQPIQL